MLQWLDTWSASQISSAYFTSIGRKKRWADSDFTVAAPAPGSIEEHRTVPEAKIRGPLPVWVSGQDSGAGTRNLWFRVDVAISGGANCYFREYLVERRSKRS